MPISGGKSFQIDTSRLSALTDKVGKRLQQQDKEMQRRITAATKMVWQIAHQKRPMAGGVSNPDAKAGVPVRTGALQASIKQNVTHKGILGYQGEVRTVGIPYSGMMEYGTSKIRARPFMRPAIALTTEAIKKMMAVKITSNLP